MMLLGAGGSRFLSTRTLVLRGIPRTATVSEVHGFLDRAVPVENIHFRHYPRSGEFTGWCEVKCADESQEKLVRSKHLSNLRFRYVEVLEDETH
mmetsp:Transcript_6075/g.14968  ORF Transcript_6075/g.14968 Transcript_6075/m.14968 type:complete len:94 (-) Transcript_6075:57-338(-)